MAQHRKDNKPTPSPEDMAFARRTLDNILNQQPDAGTLEDLQAEKTGRYRDAFVSGLRHEIRERMWVSVGQIGDNGEVMQLEKSKDSTLLVFRQIFNLSDIGNASPEDIRDLKGGGVIVLKIPAANSIFGDYSRHQALEKLQRPLLKILKGISTSITSLRAIPLQNPNNDVLIALVCSPADASRLKQEVFPGIEQALKSAQRSPGQNGRE
jgi:hypothetical protein